jgi:hypothetical protein
MLIQEKNTGVIHVKENDLEGVIQKHIISQSIGLKVRMNE